MHKTLKKVLSPFYYLFVNKYAFDDNTPMYKKILYSTRARLSGNGIFLNRSEKILKRLKNKYKGQRCFVMGNGPSLNSLDLTKLKNEYTFGVNAIYLNYEKMQFYTTFYVVEDDLVAADRKDEINNYQHSQHKFFGAYLRYLLKKDDKTILLNVLRNYESESDKEFKPSFSEDCLKKVWVGGSVTYLCLQLAYYMGFSKVYMIGFDHNYTIPKSAVISNVNEGGFDILSTEDDPNHFSPDYFGKGFRWHDPRVDRMELGFKKAREYFEKDGRELFNATFGGKLEVIQRCNYSDLF